MDLIEGYFLIHSYEGKYFIGQKLLIDLLDKLLDKKFIFTFISLLLKVQSGLLIRNQFIHEYILRYTILDIHMDRVCECHKRNKDKYYITPFKSLLIKLHIKNPGHSLSSYEYSI